MQVLKNFDVSTENRIFDANGNKVESKNVGDRFRSWLLARLFLIMNIYHHDFLDTESILDFGSGAHGGLGKGIAKLLDIPRSSLYQIDKNADQASGVHKGNILNISDLPKHQFDLGLMIQVIPFISNNHDIQTAIKNLVSRSQYSVITNVNYEMSKISDESEFYFHFRWINKNKKLCIISTKFFNGQKHSYGKFYIRHREQIEQYIIKNECQILDSGSCIYEDKPIYDFWITRNRKEVSRNE